MSDTTSDRDPLDSLAEEFLARYRAGERPSITEFAKRLPGREDEILEFIPALVEMEELKPKSDELTGDFLPPESEPEQPVRVGDYRIIRLVGRGGMGAVYEAVQESLGRHVALKLLPTDSLDDPARLERFRREARAAAQLHHTNIVPVFGVGEADGRHFYAMQFISGHPLDAVIKEVRRLKEKTSGDTREAVSELAVKMLTGSLANAREDDAKTFTKDRSHLKVNTPTESHPALSGSLSDGGRHYWTTIARLGSQVADAISYAHGQGVLHRDIKPANLLLDLQGMVWVADFGLAKLNDSDNLTQTGDIVGTLRYLAPERFEGSGDHRADIYAIGLTLYELLTLRPAFVAETRAKLVEQVVDANPPKPRAIDPTIPRDLETVVLKAIARDPAMRYQSASALADDLRRYLEDRPVKARRATSTEQVARWCRRNPAVAFLMAAVLVTTTMGAGVASYYAFRAEERAGEAVQERTIAFAREREALAATLEATEARTDAEKMAEEARKRLVRLYVLTGTSLQDAGNIPAALLWFHRAWERDHGDHLADTTHRDRIAGTLAEMPELLGAVFHKKRCKDAVFSPDGRRILTRTDENEAYIWDYELSVLAAPALVHGGEVRHVCYSPDGQSVATASADGTAAVWDAATGTKRFTLKHDGPLTWIAFQPDGQKIATAAEDKTVRMWSADDGKPIEWSLPIDAIVDHLAFSPDGSRLLTSGRDNFARVWDVVNHTPLSPPLPHRAPTETERFRFNQDMWPQFDTDGLTVISFDQKGLHLWRDGVTDSVQSIPEASLGLSSPALATEIRFIPNSKRILMSRGLPTALVIGLEDGTVIHQLEHPRQANLGAVSPDGKWLLTASSGGFVTLWDAASGQKVGSPMQFGDFCSALAFTSDGSRYLAASQDGTTRIYATGARAIDLRRCKDDGGRANVLLKSADGNTDFEAWSLDSAYRIKWNKQNQTIPSFSGPGMTERPVPEAGPIEIARFCHDGSLAVISGGGSIRAWNPKDVTPAGPKVTAKTFPGLDSDTLSRDGTRIVCLDDEKTVSIWDLTTGRRIFGPARHPDPGPTIFGDLEGRVTRAILSPDGRRLAVAIESSGTLSVWDVETGEILHHNRRFRGNVRRIVFSDDGRRIFLSASDNMDRTFDAATGESIGPAFRGTSLARVTVLSPDGRRVAILGQGDQRLKVIDVERGERIFSLALRNKEIPSLLWFNTIGSSVNLQLRSDRRSYTFPLPRFDVRYADAGPLFHLLTGQRIDDTDGIEFVDQFTFMNDTETYRRAFLEYKKGAKGGL